MVAATHVDLGEPRALKFMLPEALSDPEAVERFLREGRAASRLKGAHVAKVYDVGRLDDGAPYLVMEYLEGSDLQALFKNGGARPVAEVAHWLLQASEALAEAHARGIVHRDLKASNLFLAQGADGEPVIKVLDFGISKSASDASVTATNAVLGSPYYMPPEQLRSSRDVDARADVWSLGVIGYQLVAGRLPFRGKNVTDIILAVVQSEPAPLPPEVPPAFAAVLLRCLSKDPDGRPATMADLAAGLAPFAPPDPAARHVATIDRLLATGRGRVSVVDGPASAPVSQLSAWGRTGDAKSAAGAKAPSSRNLVVGILVGAVAAIAGMLVVGRPSAPDPPPGVAAPSMAAPLGVAPSVVAPVLDASAGVVAPDVVPLRSAVAPPPPPSVLPRAAPPGRGRRSDPGVFGDRK